MSITTYLLPFVCLSLSLSRTEQREEIALDLGVNHYFPSSLCLSVCLPVCLSVCLSLFLSRTEQREEIALDLGVNHYFPSSLCLSCLSVCLSLSLSHRAKGRDSTRSRCQSLLTFFPLSVCLSLSFSLAQSKGKR